ncbi:hypothetical protein [Acuticoccus sp.]|uniref:hypothetical protein n=1 Tax=Acuticoccus sp. TaxID=1904378 RepID=UPI003B51F95A
MRPAPSSDRLAGGKLKQVYVGKVRHRGAIHDGAHEAIVDRALFDAVQAKLAAGAPRRRTGPSGSPHLIAGRVFDETGDRLTPTHANKRGRRYQYYVSRRLTQRRATGAGGWRLAAGVLDGAVLDVVTGLLRARTQLVDRLGVSPDVRPSK